MVDADQHRALALVVDDSAVERLLIRQVLEQAGYKTEECSNGREALAAVRRLSPDIVFLDVLMPEMDGFEACSAIRRLRGRQGLPIIMVTGADDIESISHAYDAGATDFMVKPIHWPLLPHRVRYILRASEALREVVQSRASLAEAQRIAKLGSWQCNLDDNTVRCSGETYRIFGVKDGTIPIDHSLMLDRVHPEDRLTVRAAINQVIAENRGLDLDFRTLLPDGSVRMIIGRAQITADSDEHPHCLQMTFQDVTERHDREAKLNHLAHHDALTNLPNRTLLYDRLSNALARAARDGSLVAVHCLDLDHFKQVNDTFGHPIGDQLLQAAVKRLLDAVRETDTVARVGGDEFTIVQVGLGRPEHAEVVANRIIEGLSTAFEIEGRQIQLGGSIGTTLYPTDAGDPDQLLTNADTALYRAKEEGRNCSRFFVAEMDDVVRTRKKLLKDLQQGLKSDQFEVHYQPLVKATNGEIVGAEALLRMRHPDRDLLLPQDFIPLSEETGLIVPLGKWALQTACTQAASWLSEGVEIRLAVNLSPVQFRHEDLEETVRSALKASKLPPSQLELDITEDTLIHAPTDAYDVLTNLKELGVHIAIDDFGVGYSSLNHLKLFPFDRIKIDRSVIKQLEDSEDAAEMVKAILSLGRSLGMSTTAEGVETEAQIKFLAKERCDEMQGHYFSRALEAARLSELLRTSNLTRLVAMA